jgi:hypothetical protein
MSPMEPGGSSPEAGHRPPLRRTLMHRDTPLSEATLFCTVDEFLSAELLANRAKRGLLGPVAQRRKPHDD